MTGWLLDTNILSDLVRNPQGRIRDRIAEFGEQAICTSVIVACELRYGARKRGSHRLSSQLDAILALIPVLPLDAVTDHHYAIVRVHLERQGTAIGANDMLIAAHALAVGSTLVTDNTREFDRVPELRLVNWLQ